MRKTICLGDMATYINGYAFKPVDWGTKGLPIIRIQNLTDSGKDYNYYDGEIKEKYLVKKGDVLISWSASIGVFEWEKEDAWLNQHIFKVVFDKKEVNKQYFKYVTSYVLKKSLQYAHGSTMKHLTKSTFDKLPIPIYDLNVQRVIAEKIGKVDEAIAECDAMLADFDLLVKSRFVEMFGDNTYPKVKAAEICDFITKGTTPASKDILPSEEEDTIPYLKVYNLSFTGDLLFRQEPQYISREIHEGKLARSKVYPNDVLMNIVGPPLGKFALVTDEYSEWNINQAIAIFRAKERILPKFLLSALMQEKVIQPFIDQAVGVRQLNISLEQCRNLELILPPLEEQKKYVSFIEQVDKSKLAVQQSIETLQTLKEKLMQDYFG